MFRSIKAGVSLGAAVLVAAPGCCLPNLLCNHSSPSAETVVASYSSQHVEDYSVISGDCGCGCGVETSVVVSGDSDAYENGGFDSDQYVISSPDSTEAGFSVDGSSSSNFEPTLAETPEAAGSATKTVTDIVKPPVDLKKPLENSLPGNLLP